MESLRNINKQLDHMQAQTEQDIKNIIDQVR